MPKSREILPFNDNLKFSKFLYSKILNGVETIKYVYFWWYFSPVNYSNKIKNF